MKYIIVVVFFICLQILVFFHYQQKEKKLLKSLNAMVEKARKKENFIQTIDESILSTTENNFLRFIQDACSYEERIKKQKQDVETLISDISHQTTTPISNVLLYTELLMEENKTNKNEKYLQIIHNQTQKLEFLIGAMVKASRLENGIISTLPQTNSIQELVSEVIQQISPHAKKKNITIDFNFIEDIKAYFDLKWTKEALFNVVDNAVKYTNEDGNIEINVFSYPMFIRVEVKDSGVGIMQEEVELIFQRFYRGQNAIDEKGVGLGLYLAREIIQSEGGYMKMESKLNQGSSFFIYLPKEK